MGCGVVEMAQPKKSTQNQNFYIRKLTRKWHLQMDQRVFDFVKRKGPS